MEGGTGSVHGSVVAGWGAGGGPDINRKIVPCDVIAPQFLYPAPFPPEALNANGTRTVMDEAYEHWQVREGGRERAGRCSLPRDVAILSQKVP